MAKEPGNWPEGLTDDAHNDSSIGWFMSQVVDIHLTVLRIGIRPVRGRGI